MKARDLKKRLLALGCWLLREGSRHEIWTNSTKDITECFNRKKKMKLLGKYYKDGSFWLAEIPSIQLLDQGRTRKECLIMIQAAIKTLINKSSFQCVVTDLGDGEFAVSSSDVKFLSAFIVRRLREAQGLTIREVASMLKMKSHTEYARHENGTVAMNLETFNRYVEALTSMEVTLQIA